MKLPPFMDIFSSAHASANNIFAVIDQRSKLDPMRGSGKIVDTMKIKGDIEFKDVSFRYPSRPDAQVIVNTDLLIIIIIYIFMVRTPFLDIEWVKSKNQNWQHGGVGWKFGQRQVHMFASFAALLRSKSGQLMD